MAESRVPSEDLLVIDISYTFDDGRASHVSPGAAILEEFGLAGTFYVCPGLIRKDRYGWKPKDTVYELASWGEIEAACRGGHEIGNHSWSHIVFNEKTKGRTDKEVENIAGIEIGAAAMMLKDELKQKCFSWAWPCYQEEPRVQKWIDRLHVGVRPSRPRGPYGALRSKKKFLQDTSDFVDMLIATGRWGVPTIHDLGEGYGKFPPDVFRKHLEYVLSKKEIRVRTVAEVLSEA